MGFILCHLYKPIQYTTGSKQNQQNGSYTGGECVINMNAFSISKKKWRSAYMAICSLRILKELVVKEKDLDGLNNLGGAMGDDLAMNMNKQRLLQARCNQLITHIGKVGLVVAFFVLTVFLVGYFTGNNTKHENGNKEFKASSKAKFNNEMNAIMGIVSAAVTIVVVAKLNMCEAKNLPITVCMDITGALTLKQMEVTNFWVGQEPVKDDSVSTITTTVLQLIHQGVGLNTTDIAYSTNTTRATPEFSSCPNEKAILSWATMVMGLNVKELKQNYSILHVKTFNSEKIRSGVLMRKDGESTIHAHWKGAAEMVLAMCSSYYESDGKVKVIDEGERVVLERIIREMSTKCLRCIAFAHKPIPEDQMDCKEDGTISELLKEDGLTLLGIVGIKDPCRPGVKKAVGTCKEAGLNMKMITGDNVFTARAVASECGFLEQNGELNTGVVVEGLEFRNYTQEERMEKVERIRVMARSSFHDKRLMVQCLKQRGHVVVVTGDGTNDAVGWKEADTGVSTEFQGTEVAKCKSPDITVLDDSFVSVATGLRWGLRMYNKIKKFIEFQLAVNVTALVINLVAMVSVGKVPLTAVHLLWVSLIMDVLGNLALANELSIQELMEPAGQMEPLTRKIMWMNLVAQALYQMAILLIIQFRSEAIFSSNEKVKSTLMFNAFVLCQVFNVFNAMNPERNNRRRRNFLFLCILGITIVQVVLTELLKWVADEERLNWTQWGACILIAAISWSIGWVVNCITVSRCLDLSRFSSN